MKKFIVVKEYSKLLITDVILFILYFVTNVLSSALITAGTTMSSVGKTKIKVIEFILAPIRGIGFIIKSIGSIFVFLHNVFLILGIALAIILVIFIATKIFNAKRKRDSIKQTEQAVQTIEAQQPATTSNVQTDAPASTASTKSVSNLGKSILGAIKAFNK